MVDKITYGSEGWTVEEIFTHVFSVSFDETLGMVELRRVGAELAKTHHQVSFEAARATELMGLAEEAMDIARSEVAENLRLQEEKTTKKKMPAAQRNELIEKKIEPFVIEHKRKKYEVSLWNRVLESLKYVAKRVDSLTIIESVEAKLLGAGSSLIDTDPFSRKDK